MKDLLITVPYRDRKIHLEKFLKVVPEFFKNSNITFDIVICELEEGGDWNAGLCNNSIIHYLNNTIEKYKYIYIHHVDVYPLEGSLPIPGENECIYNLGDYGSCILSLENFLKCGGYGNSFWGWGSEDNHLYTKLLINGIKNINLENLSTKSIVFDKNFQNHARIFNGKNYAHNIKLLYSPLDAGGNIYNFDEYASVISLSKIQENVYHQMITPKHISPDKKINTKAIITYVENQNSFFYVTTFVKSAMLWASNQYDVIVIIGDEPSDSNISKEVIAFGGIPIQFKKNIPISKNIPSLQRFYAYKEFLETNTQYTEILHADAGDVLFLRNPFEHIDREKINFVAEDILVKNQSWNLNTVNHQCGWDDGVKKILHESVVLCGGVIYAPANMLLKLINAILVEFETKTTFFFGMDQPIINKIIYVDKLFEADEMVFKTTYDTLAINLHAPLNDSKYEGKPISNPPDLQSLKQYAIIHQYNRSHQLSDRIQNFFRNFYYPIINP